MNYLSIIVKYVGNLFFFSKLYGIEINIAQKQFTNLEKIIVVLMYTFRLHFKNLWVLNFINFLKTINNTLCELPYYYRMYAAFSGIIEKCISVIQHNNIFLDLNLNFSSFYLIPYFKVPTFLIMIYTFRFTHIQKKKKKSKIVFTKSYIFLLTNIF